MTTFKRISAFLSRAYNGLKSLTDPASEGNPYIENDSFVVPSSRKTPFIFSKRMIARI